MSVCVRVYGNWADNQRSQQQQQDQQQHQQFQYK